jgi:F0F1-type ATP synthase membrane subunit c/vacuolar-type H+-ATPase subunit K
MVRGILGKNSAKPVERGGRSKRVKFSAQVLLAAALAVGLVAASPAVAQAPLVTQAQKVKTMSPKAYARYES